jgi:hypothetical protein
MIDDLQKHDAGGAAAIASRILLEGDDRSLWRLLDYAHLLAHAPELRPALEHLRRHTPDTGVHERLATLLAAPAPAPAPAYPAPDPAAGLDAAQRARLLREALRWAIVALDPVAADRAELGALDILRGWIDAPGARLPGATSPGVVGDCLRAAASGDLRAALDAGVEAAVEAARRGDDAMSLDPHRAADLARLAQLFTARQIQAGREPLPPRRLSPLLLSGPDSLAVGMDVAVPSVPLCLRQPRAMPSGHGPDRAAWLTGCATCDGPVRLQGPLEWVYRDDDRFAESEDGYAGYLAGTCAACAARRRVEVRLDVTISRGNGSAELTWWSVEDRRGPS